MVATEIPVVSLPTVATDPNSQSTTIVIASSYEGPRALTVSDSLTENCDSETRIDHQVGDDDKRASPNSIRTIDGLDSSSSSDGGSSESSLSNDMSRKRSRSPSDDGRGNSKEPTSQRSHLRGPPMHPLNMATTGRDNSLGTIGTTMDSSVIARLIEIVKII